MVGPVMRTLGPPDLKVHTMPMPHLMFYAPHVTNEDLGAESRQICNSHRSLFGA